MAELKDWGQFAREHPGAAIVLVNWDRHAAEPDRIASALAKAGLGSVQSLACPTAFCGLGSIATGWASYPIRG